MNFDDFNGFDFNGRVIFARGDLTARRGLHDMSRAHHDIERGIIDMQRGMAIAQFNSQNDNGCRAFRDQFCRCFCNGNGFQTLPVRQTNCCNSRC